MEIHLSPPSFVYFVYFVVEYAESIPSMRPPIPLNFVYTIRPNVI